MIDRAVPGLRYHPRDLTVLSAHVGNHQFHPRWTLLIGQFGVR
jgi:hypothetical protein